MENVQGLSEGIGSSGEGIGDRLLERDWGATSVALV